MSILVDINGTIVKENKVIQHVVDYLHTVEEDIYVISGSTVSKMQEYQNLLNRLNIKYKEIILNPINEDTDHSFKTTQASRIPNLVLAIDNNVKILKLYSSMGIDAIHPNSLKS
jgi:cupin superfamily acireductone dioxygenase involved in methionine salvage